MPESPALGGFGYDIDGRLFNVDTLKFFEVLDRHGARRRARRACARSTGRSCARSAPGWGGFAYQFKTLFPRATYVIVDFPELFLFSATYLGAVFPEARLLFVGDGRRGDARRLARRRLRVRAAHAAPLVSTLPLDLIVNMVSFQEMTDAQVRGYAAMAAPAGCPLLYSLNRERSLYNTELVSVSEALADWYRLTEVPVLDTDYTERDEEAAEGEAHGRGVGARYRHSSAGSTRRARAPRRRAPAPRRPPPAPASAPAPRASCSA